jgi:rhodanese-related sulfurtransferase
MKTYRDLVAEAKRAVPEVSVEDVHARLAKGESLALVDVRDPDEYREGAVAGAVPISRGFLEFKVPEAFPDPRPRSSSTASRASARSWPARCSTTSATRTWPPWPVASAAGRS